MKKILFILTVFTNTISYVYSKTIDIDMQLSKLFNEKQYEKCYKLSKIASSNKYSEYVLAPYNIKYKESYVFLSDSAKYFEYKALRVYDPDAFNYFYMIKNQEVLKIFDKADVYPAFIKWADSLYNSPINNGFNEMLDNMKTKKYKSNDDIPVIKQEHLKNYKLHEIYVFLKETDSIACSKIFKVDNKKLVELVKNRGTKDLLNLPSSDFNISTCKIYGKEYDKIQKNIITYYDSLFNAKRFLTKEQISEFLFSNTNFTEEEKMFVTFYFVHSYLRYNAVGKFANLWNIDKIILNRETICNGYSLVLRYFLTTNNIKCYKITLKTDELYMGISTHANNIVVINNKVYYVDVTWGVYYQNIEMLPDTKTITEWQLTPVKLNYKNIKNFGYITDVEGYDASIIKEFEKITNKKGAN